ncbi:adenine-specific DNA-methyltransferase [Pseudomonas sp. NFACC23-1]|uniref:HsdM family class I SAM-dependent methyltransferase n=1 Tax=unclassified Pseudomonas TaxID=196821 RepID=UPI000884DDC5|nr:MULTISPECIES: N-6 DNA methylase [unclassified Pseudomonas]SDB21655.1 adenine-specific DNA-methyltransferase [Pseudomonas sp. NFACC17-2]SEJ31959.1 adenine-specific DNA-methyltransferase [Pseudomonas sp. NFACC23-1]SFW63226.1 adenine-specific DNA-methyltransferase [Pseudomonas sp. NFACC16-2]
MTFAELDVPFAIEAPVQSLVTARATARALAAGFPIDKQLSLARAFGVRLIEAWWRGLNQNEIAPQELRAPIAEFETSTLSDAASLLAEQIGTAAAEFDAETAAYQIGLTYTSMLPVEHRGEYGIFYTPPALTARLIDQATSANVDWAKCRVLDPACGGGAFLAPIAQRIMKELAQCSPRLLLQSIGNRLHGFEIDPFGAWLSQVTLDAVLLPISRPSGLRLPVMITVCDSLRNNPPKDGFDLVIGNPPYGKAKLDVETRELYKRSLYGHANLYGLFTDFAIRQTKPGGLIAFVTPTSFLAGGYFKNLRALIGQEAPPISIDFVAARKGVFDDVLQEMALTTYRKAGEAVPVVVSEIISADGVTEIRETGSIVLPKDCTLPWLLPRNPNQTKLVGRLSEMPHRLVDWGYRVSTGPLVWNRHKSQLTYQAGSSRLPLIWAEAITADGEFVFRAEKKNHAPYFELAPSDQWLVTTQPCVLLQRTTAKEQSRRLIAAALPIDFLQAHGGVVIENHINMVRPITDVPKVNTAVLAAFLNSGAADRAFRCVSGSVAVSAYELESLPLPDPAALKELARLVESDASKESIEAACSKLF